MSSNIFHHDHCLKYFLFKCDCSGIVKALLKPSAADKYSLREIDRWDLTEDSLEQVTQLIEISYDRSNKQETTSGNPSKFAIIKDSIIDALILIAASLSSLFLGLIMIRSPQNLSMLLTSLTSWPGNNWQEIIEYFRIMSKDLSAVRYDATIALRQVWSWLHSNPYDLQQLIVVVCGYLFQWPIFSKVWSSLGNVRLMKIALNGESAIENPNENSITAALEEHSIHLLTRNANTMIRSIEETKKLDEITFQTNNGEVVMSFKAGELSVIVTDNAGSNAKVDQWLEKLSGQSFSSYEVNTKTIGRFGDDFHSLEDQLLREISVLLRSDEKEFSLLPAGKSNLV